MEIYGKKYLTALAIMAFVLAGCSSNDGKDGKDGESTIIGILPASSATSVAITIDDVEINSAPVVTFSARDASGIPLAGLTTSHVRFNIAKLVPGSMGDPSTWQNYINVERSGAEGTFLQGTSERVAANLEDLGNGQYRYTFGTDITDPTKTVGNISYDPSLTHRVAMQISGFPATNPTFDFRPDGGAISKREIVKTETCNSCHNKLAIHGGGRVEAKYCVTCHNPGSTDPDTGNTVDFKVMIHKIHRGEDLPSVEFGPNLIDEGGGGDDGTGVYQIIGYGGSVHDYSTVVFPQDIRNCTKCHDGADPDTPQGNNWQTRVSMEACGSCHDNVDFSKDGSAAGANDPLGHSGGIVSNNSECLTCHATGRIARSVEATHFLAEPVAREKFKLNILKICGVEVDSNPGPICAPGVTPTVTYAVTDPTNGDARYPITAPEIAGSNLSFLVAWDTRDYNNTDGTGARPARAGDFSARTGAVENSNIPHTIVDAGPGSNDTVSTVGSGPVTPFEGAVGLEIDFQDTMGTDGAAIFDFTAAQDASAYTSLHFAIDTSAVPSYADLVVQLEDGIITPFVFLSDYTPLTAGGGRSIYDIPLADFTGLNLSNLTRIGFWSLSSSAGSVTLTFGKVYIDDIQLQGAGTWLPVFTERYERTYTVTAGFDIPNGAGATAFTASGSGAIGAQGRLVGDFDGDTVYGESGSNNTVTGEQERIFVKSEVEYFRIDDPTVVARRPTVDNAKCNKCHDQIVFHGGSRSGEYAVCILCHNPNNTDIARRPADPNDAVDGKVEESIDMKRMIHGIHAGAVTNYDNSAGHGFREKGLVLYGYGGGDHDYSHVRFPGILNDCETCHEPGAFNLDGIWESPTANGILGSTVDSGFSVNDPDDDLNISPTAAVCSACHDGATARAHMETLGGAVFDQDQFTIDGAMETCSVCHGPGHLADVEMVHSPD